MHINIEMQHKILCRKSDVIMLSITPVSLYSVCVLARALCVFVCLCVFFALYVGFLLFLLLIKKFLLDVHYVCYTMLIQCSVLYKFPLLLLLNVFLVVKISIIPTVQHSHRGNGVSFRAIQSFVDDFWQLTLLIQISQNE